MSCRIQIPMAAMVLIFLLVSLVQQAAAQAASPAPDCTSALAPAVPCLGYVQGTDASPSKDCCSGLKGLVKSNPYCLCSLAGGKLELPGITFDKKRALALPTACKLSGTDASQCSALLGSGPVSSPAAGPHPAMTPGSDEASANSPKGNHSPAASPISGALLFGIFAAIAAW